MPETLHIYVVIVTKDNAITLNIGGQVELSMSPDDAEKFGFDLMIAATELKAAMAEGS